MIGQVNSPFFSVVIPTYNRAKFVSKTIYSILNQCFNSFELIVVDDGSTDETEMVISAIKDSRIIYKRKENEERGAARNYGALLAKGEFINFIDSDDIVYPYHLQSAKDFIISHKQIDVFHIGYDIKYSNGVVLRECQKMDEINDKILSGNVLSTNGVFIKRKVAIDNPFSNSRDLSSMEDWELWLRLASRYKFWHCNAITSTVIQHEDRSVMDVNIRRIVKKIELFQVLVLSDEVNQKTFGAKLNRVLASANTYAALHLAIAKAPKLQIVKYLIDGLRFNVAEVFKRRFLVIIKLLIFTRS